VLIRDPSHQVNVGICILVTALVVWFLNLLILENFSKAESAGCVAFHL